MVYDPGPIDLLLLQRHLPGKHDQSTHGKKKGASAVLGTAAPTAEEPATPASHGGVTTVDALPRMAAKPSVTVAAKGTNPNYGSSEDNPVYRDTARAGQHWTPEMGLPPSGAYEQNCTNCVHTFEMRMRGYDVQAAPLHILDKHGYAMGRTYREVDEQVASSWRLPNGRPHGRNFSDQKWRSFEEIDSEVAGWPEGGRGFVTTGRHVFSVVNTRGKPQYVEAQYDASPTRVVTTAYRRKFRGGKSFSTGQREDAKLIRLDDLVPAAGILDAVAVVM